MPEKVPVLNKTTGKTVLMWEVDAEEAVRNGPTLWAHVVAKPPPPKNPGGRGF
jgi:hypothetical protein